MHLTDKIIFNCSYLRLINSFFNGVFVLFLFYTEIIETRTEFQKHSASVIGVMDCIWQHRRKFKNLLFVMSFGK